MLQYTTNVLYSVSLAMFINYVINVINYLGCLLGRMTRFFFAGKAQSRLTSPTPPPLCPSDHVINDRSCPMDGPWNLITDIKACDSAQQPVVLSPFHQYKFSGLWYEAEERGTVWRQMQNQCPHSWIVLGRYAICLCNYSVPASSASHLFSALEPEMPMQTTYFGSP